MNKGLVLPGPGAKQLSRSPYATELARALAGPLISEQCPAAR